jgi:hypothetical protein
VAPRLRVDQPTQTMEKLGGFFLAPILKINQFLFENLLLPLPGRSVQKCQTSCMELSMPTKAKK